MSDANFHRDVDVFQPDPRMVVRQEKPDQCIVRFYKEWIESKGGHKSAKGLRGHFEDKVEIIFPGDMKTVLVRAATDRDKRKWPRQWAVYQGSEEAIVEGTPLTTCAFLSRSWVDTLKHFHVTTVEQLANLNDSAIQNVGMGCRELVKKAQAYINQDKANVTDGLIQENELLKKRLEALERQVMTEPNKRGPGRPKRQEQSEVV